MIITLTNHKGGVGKTTTALELLYGLHQKGYKTLGIDLDQQCNFSILVNSNLQQSSIADLIQETKNIDEVIQTTPAGDFIAGNMSINFLISQLPKMKIDFFLTSVLKDIKSNYDYIIIDTPPALSDATLNAYNTSDYLLIPAGADFLSEMGFLSLQREIKSVQEFSNPNLKVMGILLNRIKNGNFPKLMLEEFEKKAQNIFNTHVMNNIIRDSLAVQESQFMKQSIFDYKKQSDKKENITNDYLDLIKEVEEYENR